MTVRFGRKEEFCDMEKKKCVLTGATGHVGYALLLELLEQGEDVTITLRKEIDIFDGLACRHVKGDITDYPSLLAAFEGADTVYHVAGAVEINRGMEDMTWKINYEGTKNVLKACQECKVRRLVYMSSVDAMVPLPDNQLMVEQTSFSPDGLDGTYAKTKASATQYLLDNHGDVELVVLHPSACIGPYDFKVSSIGSMVRMMLKGSFPVTMNFGAYNFVDVRDVAKGTYAAAQRGRNGECYILCGKSVSVDEFIKTCARVIGNKPPRLVLGNGIVSVAAPIMEVYYQLSKSTPLFTRYSIRKLKANCNFSYEKAERELGYHPMDLETSVADMVSWIRENS